MSDPIAPDLHSRIERLERRWTAATTLSHVWDILYEQGNLGSVLDNLEDMAARTLHDDSDVYAEPPYADPPARCIDCDAPFPTHNPGCRHYYLHGGIDPE